MLAAGAVSEITEDVEDESRSESPDIDSASVATGTLKLNAVFLFWNYVSIWCDE